MSILHIVVKYLRLSDSVLSFKDDIRISITSLPTHQKENFVIPIAKIALINHEFAIQNDPADTEVLFNFRRKNFINGDPIIGKSLLKKNTIPNDHTFETELKIYEVIQNDYQDKDQFVQIGECGIKAYFDNFCKKKISSYYSTPASVNKDLQDLETDGNVPAQSFFRNIGSRRRNRKFVAFEDTLEGGGGGNSIISGSRSDFGHFDPL